jgi:16S rRNA (guanine966-N2)-methyltransferase
MRIITGCAKGIKLKAPPGFDTRPTTDRVKESLFNILGPLVNNAAVLDLFAGTGGLGLEALSRGARHAVFIDQSPVSINIIKDNATHTHLAAQAEIYKSDVPKALCRLKRESKLFDIVFCDPPYNRGWVAAILALLDGDGIMNPGAVLVLEHSRHEMVDTDWQVLHGCRTERYGETLVSFMKKDDNKTLGG